MPLESLLRHLKTYPKLNCSLSGKACLAINLCHLSRWQLCSSSLLRTKPPEAPLTALLSRVTATHHSTAALGPSLDPHSDSGSPPPPPAVPLQPTLCTASSWSFKSKADRALCSGASDGFPFCPRQTPKALQWLPRPLQGLPPPPPCAPFLLRALPSRQASRPPEGLRFRAPCPCLQCPRRRLAPSSSFCQMSPPQPALSPSFTTVTSGSLPCCFGFYPQRSSPSDKLDNLLIHYVACMS